MISGFIVKKGLMTSMYTEDGRRIAVTRCTAQPLVVTQVKTIEKDGYQAVQVAYGVKKNIDKAVSSKISKLGLDIKPLCFKEFKLTSDQIPEVGKTIAIDEIFTVGEKIDVTGTSKGRGFAGVIKRHGFHKQPIRGSSDRVRHPGSIGAQTPSKVVRGKRMPGHYGNDTQTMENLKVIAINKETNEITVSGSFSGHLNSWVTLTKQTKYENSNL